jgi:hypothetical protein
MSTRSNGVNAQRIILCALTELDQILKLFVIGVFGDCDFEIQIPTDMQCKSVTRPVLNYIKESAFDFLSVGHTLVVD